MGRQAGTETIRLEMVAVNPQRSLAAPCLLAPPAEPVLMKSVKFSGESGNTPLPYSINNTRSLLGGQSRRCTHAQIAANHIRAVKLGRRMMIPATAVEALATTGATQ